MGYMRHHAIVVTTFTDELIAKAHAKAVELGCAVSNIVGPVTNGNVSFFIAPDGSKEGWDQSDKGDTARDLMVEWLDAQAFEDGSNCLSWAEIMYADENHGEPRSSLVRTNAGTTLHTGDLPLL